MWELYPQEPEYIRELIDYLEYPTTQRTCNGNQEPESTTVQFNSMP